jgi:hypothetical protein
VVSTGTSRQTTSKKMLYGSEMGYDGGDSSDGCAGVTASIAAQPDSAAHLCIMASVCSSA